tara:strand:+ start:266 stop:421 length:156 start_codon:yes stop_codon:yes gene_type:complete
MPLAATFRSALDNVACHRHKHENARFSPDLSFDELSGGIVWGLSGQLILEG